MMRIRKLIAAVLLAALMTAMAAVAQADSLESVWMEYEDYSGGRAEQSVEELETIRTIEKILLRAKSNPAKLDGCTMNCTLFCMTDSGEIYGFACATDGCPYIQAETDGAVYTLGVDYQAFWDIFDDVREGMGFDASAFFDFDD